MRQTKIVATLGPASLQRETLVGMLRAGMNVARINTSHGNTAQHLEAIALVRSVAAEERQPVAILLDLGGPKIRTGPTEGGRPIPLSAGDIIRIVPEEIDGTKEAVTVEYPQLLQDVHAGDRVLIDDGKLELQVTQAEPTGLVCQVIIGGALLPRKGVSFPASRLTAPALTERDQECMRMGVEAGVDFFALSFVRDHRDIVRARNLLQELGADIPIIAKIERHEAVENLDAIIAEADGAMVARGDLGVELPPEDVPVQQRRIIDAAATNMIPVITATQMLESMIEWPRPTRAESSDVANAVWALSDALMLSGETAIGRYPVETVAMMDRIIRKAESAPGAITKANPPTDADDHSYIVALAARQIVETDENMRGIVCFTRSGYTAFLMSKVHPEAPIFAMTPNDSVWRRLSLARGVTPILAPLVESSDQLLKVVDELPERQVLEIGDEVVVVASLPVSARGTTNFLKLHHLGESLHY